jgi:hypothetical protein
MPPTTAERKPPALRLGCSPACPAHARSAQARAATRHARQPAHPQKPARLPAHPQKPARLRAHPQGPARLRAHPQRPSAGRARPPERTPCRGRAMRPTARSRAAPCSRQAPQSSSPQRPNWPASSRRPGFRAGRAYSKTSSRGCHRADARPRRGHPHCRRAGWLYSGPRRASTTQVVEGGGPNAERVIAPRGRIGPSGP